MSSFVAKPFGFTEKLFKIGKNSKNSVNTKTEQNPVKLSEFKN